MGQFKKLFEKSKIGNVELKNRVVLPPMGVGLADASGKVNDLQMAYFESIAKGGVGLITSSCIAVDDEFCGLVEPGQISLAKEGVFDGLKDLVDVVHKYDAKIIFQLLHPGRQASSIFNNGQQPVAPSALKEADYLEMPRALTTEEVKKLIQKFIDGAKIVYETGADGIELHGAHGYMIHQFMSARANQRTDEYGGSFENRMRFVTEIAEGIQAIKPENTILSIRINGIDDIPGGMTSEDCVQIAKYLEKIGFDTISVSRCTYTNAYGIAEPAIYPEGCRTPVVKQIKDAIHIPVIAVNNIKRPQTAEKILEDGICDYVAIGRGILADPEWVNKAAAGKENTIRTCIDCCNCVDTVQTGHPASCSMNPRLGKGKAYDDEAIIRNGDGRNIAVIGGGPGGMEASITAAKRGFHVTLFDKNDQLGGSLILAAKGQGKDKVQSAVDAMKTEVASLDIDVRLNTEVKDIDTIAELNPYAVILAAGGTPIVPPIPGINSDKVVLAHDVLAGKSEIKDKKVALIGSGMTGLETAELLAPYNKVVVFDMLDEVAKGANLSNKIGVMGYLAQYGVEYMTQHKLTEITEKGIVVEDLVNQTSLEMDFDTVVLSLGVKPNKALQTKLEEKFERVVCIGDCAKGTKIIHAIGDGLEKVWNI